MKIIHGMQQGSKEWLEFRRKHIGASDAGTILGINPYDNTSQLMDEKINGTSKPMNENMRNGQVMEPEARLAYEIHTGYSVEPLVAEHETHDFLSASFDGVTDDLNHGVEIKCGKQSHLKAIKGQIPPYYMAQLQHQMMIAGWKKMHYWSYRDGQGILIVVERNEEFISDMLDKQIDFWNSVTQFTAPGD